MGTITSLSISNFLSFRRLDLRLGSLNVLVGPNGTGKTNLLAVFQFLGEIARSDLVPAIESFGGFDALRFRGRGSKERTISIDLTGQITKHASPNAPDEYRLSFWEQKFKSAQGHEFGAFIRRNERILLKRTSGRGRRITLNGGSVHVIDISDKNVSETSRKQVTVQSSSSGLAILRRLGKAYDAEQVETLAEIFEELRLFEVNVEKVRQPTVSVNDEHLLSDGSNVAGFLHWLSSYDEGAYQRVREDVRFVLPSFEDFVFTPVGGSDSALRLEIKERALEGLTPLARTSYGTIRAIALFAMLHDPHPPKLTCLEEVDHGFHPHALDRIVDRLKEASTRTQIIAATHSPALVNRLDPSCLLVFERDAETGATRKADVTVSQMRRMQADSGYGLGELWFSGTLGGVP